MLTPRAASALIQLRDMERMLQAVYYATDSMRRQSDVFSQWHLDYLERTHANAAALKLRITRTREALENNKG